MKQILIKLENASVVLPGAHPREPVLKNISWEIEAGSRWLLEGPNGSGKSTLLKLLHGELWTEAGKIAWLERDHPDSSRLAAMSISALVSPHVQENCQRQGWQVSIREMLLGALTDAPISGIRIGESSPESLALVECFARDFGAGPWLDLTIPELSQGQLRIALLARALLRKPKALLLDECLDGLDASHKELFCRILENVPADMAIVYAAHRPLELGALFRERAWMNDGRLLFHKPENEAKVINSSAFNRLEDTVSVPDKDPNPIFELENVDVFIDRKRVLRDITWRMAQGENWRVAGPNGSGKSTFLRLLAGDETAAAGGSIKRWAPKLQVYVYSLEEMRQSFFLVSDLGQALYAYPLNGLELVCSGFEQSIGIYRDFTLAELSIARDLIHAFFDAKQGDALSRKSIRAMSSGQLRRLFLARALVNRPDVLLLDEPCTGLDADSRAGYLELVDQLASGNIAGYRPRIVFVSHHDEDTPSCVSHIAHFRDGAISNIERVSGSGASR